MKQFKNSRKLFADPLKFYKLNGKKEQQEQSKPDINNQEQNKFNVGTQSQNLKENIETPNETNINTQQIINQSELQINHEVTTSKKIKKKARENKYLKQQQDFLEKQKAQLKEEIDLNNQQKPQKDVSDESDQDESQKQTIEIKQIDQFENMSEASFYGPIYPDADDFEENQDEKQPIKINQKRAKKGGHRYLLVKESHAIRKEFLNQDYLYYNDQEYVDEIRKYLLTHKDPRGYTLLHIAAELGDKYFTTMILFEAKELRVLDEIINSKNGKNFTPLYLLCQTGFRKFVIEEYFLSKWHIKKEDEKQPPSLEDLIDYLNEHKEDVDFSDEQKVAHGLIFTMGQPMPDLIDKKQDKDNPQSDQIDESDHENDNQQGGYKCYKPSRVLLVQLLLENGADASFQTYISKMTPLHWLAYWGDYRATIVYLKKNKSHLEAKTTIFTNEVDYFKKHGAANAYLTFNNATPVDIAGTQRKWMTLFVIMRHFLENYQEIEKAFLTDKIRQRYPKDRFSQNRWKNLWSGQSKDNTDYSVDPTKVELVFFSSQSLNTIQKSYLKIAYWTIYLLAEIKRESQQTKKLRKIIKEFLYFMLLDIGISPLIQIQQGETIFHACIKTKQLNVLKMLLSHTYVVQNEKQKQLLLQSIQNNDERGENIFHEVFKLEEELRNQFLAVLIDKNFRLKIQVGDFKQTEKLFKKPNWMNQKIIPNETEDQETDKLSSDDSEIEQENKKKGKNICCSCKRKEQKLFSQHRIGQMNRPNNLGHFPYEYDHCFPGEMNRKPGKKFSDFELLCLQNRELREIYMQSMEADYQLELTEGNTDFKLNLLKEKLIESGMKEDIDFFIFLEKNRTIFALKFSTNKLDQIAEEISLQCDLIEYEARTPFKILMKEEFTMFSEREKYNCIAKFLFRDLQLELLVLQQIIKENHYFMHKKVNKKYTDGITEAFFKLFPKLIFGGWAEDAQIIHLVKRYFGEDYSYFLFYFFTYQANLVIPMIFGLIISIIAFIEVQSTGDVNKLDTSLNTLYAFQMIIWSTFFVEKWKNNQQKLSFKWSQDQIDDLEEIDERYGDYINEAYFNHNVNQKLKKAAPSPKGLGLYFSSFFTIMIILTIGSTILSRYLATIEEDEYIKQLGEIKNLQELGTQISERDNDFLNEAQSFVFKKWKTIVYRIILFIFSALTTAGLKQLIYLRNHQFRKDYLNDLQQYQFFFELVNTFFPLFVIAFYNQSKIPNQLAPNLSLDVPTNADFSALFTFLLIDNLKDALFYIRQYFNLSVSKIKDISIQFIRDPKKTYNDLTKKEIEWQRFIESLDDENKKNTDVEQKILPTSRVIIQRQIDSNNSKLRTPFDTNQVLYALVLQFGVLAMFAQVYPIGSVICFFINLVFLIFIPRLMIMQQRQIPKFADGIGAFCAMIDFLSVVAVVINFALMFFTSKQLYQFFATLREKYTTFEFFVIIVAVEHLLQLIKYIISISLQNNSYKFNEIQEIRVNYLKDFNHRLNEKLKQFKKEVLQTEKIQNEAIKIRLLKLRREKESKNHYHTKAKMIARGDKFENSILQHLKLYQDDKRDPVPMDDQDLINIFQENIKRNFKRDAEKGF